MTDISAPACAPVVKGPRLARQAPRTIEGAGSGIARFASRGVVFAPMDGAMERAGDVLAETVAADRLHEMRRGRA